MTGTIYIEFTHDEVNQNLPYSLICETREGATWNQMRRKRRWLEEFSESERRAAEKIFALAHTWTLVKGAPEKVRMQLHTYELWQKLGAFCASI